MRALRTILNLIPHKRTSHSSLTSIRLPQAPHPSTQLHYVQFVHSSNHLHHESSGFNVTAPRSWTRSNRQSRIAPSTPQDPNKRVHTSYDPISGQVITTRGVDFGENPDDESISSCGGEDLTNASDGSNLGREESLQGRRGREKFIGQSSVSKRLGLGGGRNLGFKKKGKSRESWVCSDCGNQDSQWWGACRTCNSVGTLKKFSEGDIGGSKGRGLEVSENAVGSWLPQQAADLQPMRLTDVNRGINEINWRIPLSGLFGNEVARVLGGGIVPGSLILVGGDPGVGKSTLLLQIAAIIAEGHGFGDPAPVVYVSGEESVEQIGSRADRMRIATEELFLYSSTDIEDILEKIRVLYPRALIVDSIQTVYLRGVVGSAGGLQQVKECTSALLRFAKMTNIPVLLIGHVTKSGDIAGPRVLEHIVDAVLYMEGEKCSCHRLLRSVKNRFGSTDELGVFEMSQLGLQTVSNPSQMFLTEQISDSEFLAGLAIAVIIDGSRTFLLEIQALCVSGSSVHRQVNGVQESRADMIISVLTKQAGLKLQVNAIFINVVSGVKLTETAGDLAIAAAIFTWSNLFPTMLLSSEKLVLVVPRMEKRVTAVAKLGYKKCIVPKSAEQSLLNLGFQELIVACKNLKEDLILLKKLAPYQRQSAFYLIKNIDLGLRNGCFGEMWLATQMCEGALNPGPVLEKFIELNGDLLPN
ncbi:hypothetical protein RJ641_024074, partial [Dillenia turbinata]